MVKIEKSNIWIKLGLRFCRLSVKEESKYIRVGSKIEIERRDRICRVLCWLSKEVR